MLFLDLHIGIMLIIDFSPFKSIINIISHKIFYMTGHRLAELKQIQPPRLLKTTAGSMPVSKVGHFPCLQLIPFQRVSRTLVSKDPHGSILNLCSSPETPDIPIRTVLLSFDRLVKPLWASWDATFPVHKTKDPRRPAIHNEHGRSFRILENCKSQNTTRHQNEAERAIQRFHFRAETKSRQFAFSKCPRLCSIANIHHSSSTRQQWVSLPTPSATLHLFAFLLFGWQAQMTRLARLIGRWTPTVHLSSCHGSPLKDGSVRINQLCVVVGDNARLKPSLSHYPRNCEKEKNIFTADEGTILCIPVYIYIQYMLYPA